MLQLDVMLVTQRAVGGWGRDDGSLLGFSSKEDRVQAPVKYYRPGEERAVKRGARRSTEDGGFEAWDNGMRPGTGLNRLGAIKRPLLLPLGFSSHALQTAKQINATNEKQSVKNNDFPSPDSSMPLLLPHRWVCEAIQFIPING